MKEIESLTEEQKAKFPEYVDKYIKIGLSTEPANFEEATEAALKAYALCNLDKPIVILRMDSPYGATIGGAMAFGLLQELKQKTTKKVWSQVRSQVESQVLSQVESQVRSQVESQVLSQVGSQVWSQVWSQVESQVWSQVRSQVESQVLSQVESQVRSQVWSQVESQVESQVWSQVRSQVWSQVESQVRSQVWSQVGSQVRSQVEDAIYNNRGGAFWASWAAYISFLRDECGWNGDTLNRFEIDETLVKSCGWVWWHENVLAISDRPLEINRDEQGRLHGENKPSMIYRDGWRLYNWHGVSVPEKWIMDKTNTTASEVLAVTNTEQRAAGAEIIGWGKIEKELGAKIIHDSGSQDIGMLIDMTLPGLNETGRFLKAWCPRNGWIYEGVPKISDIDNLPIETALHAQAWRIGDKLSEYSHPEYRT